jgi:hypothetical protein
MNNNKNIINVKEIWTSSSGGWDRPHYTNFYYEMPTATCRRKDFKINSFISNRITYSGGWRSFRNLAVLETAAYRAKQALDLADSELARAEAEITLDLALNLLIEAEAEIGVKFYRIKIPD